MTGAAATCLDAASGATPARTVEDRIAVLEDRLARLESMVRHASANLDAHMWEEFA